MDIVTLEDNKDYIILDTLEVEGIKYVYLVESTEAEDKKVCIRKIVDNGEYIAGLDNETEYKKALNAYTDKYKDIVASAWQRKKNILY